jgi:hypothetical protein
MLAALCGSVTCAAREITQLSDLTNATVVTIERRPVEADSCGYLSYIPGEDETADYTLKVQQAEQPSDNQLWVIYNQPRDNAYYLYNVGAQRCVEFGTNNCQLTENATNVALTYVDSKESWVFSGNGYMAGLSSGLRDAVYFLSDLTNESCGIFFSINDYERTLTDEEALKMEDIVNGTRRTAIEGYRTFLATAKKVNADGYTNYCGSYDLTELERALSSDNIDQLSLPELEQMKRNAIMAGYPSPTAYYRIKNYERPNANSLTNYMTLNRNGEQLFAQNSTNVGLSNQSDNGENLRLFQFSAVDGLDYDRARIRVAAVDKGLKEGDKDFVVTFLDNSEASVFQLVKNSDSQRLFKLQYNGTNKRLTTNGVSGGQGIAINNNTENAMLWYIERVDSFTGPTLNEGGYAALTLPCPVEIPEGYEAFYVSATSNGNVKISSLGNIVPAYFPFIIKGNAGAIPTFTISEQANIEVPETQMSGTTYRIDNDRNIFTLAVNDQGGITFSRKSGIESLDANSAFIYADQLATTNDELGVYINEDIPTSAIDATTDSNNNEKYYDLQGRRIEHPANNTIIISTSGEKRLNK